MDDVDQRCRKTPDVRQYLFHDFVQKENQMISELNDAITPNSVDLTTYSTQHPCMLYDFVISEASFKSRLAQLLEEDVAADVITFSAAISACQAHGLGNTIIELVWHGLIVTPGWWYSLSDTFSGAFRYDVYAITLYLFVLILLNTYVTIVDKYVC